MRSKHLKQLLVEAWIKLTQTEENYMLPILNPIVSKHYAAQKAGILARQVKARAASKRAKQARKLNRK